MNEGRPYLQIWRGLWVCFCKIAIVSFLSVRYKSDGLYCRMAGTPSSPTLFFYKSIDRDKSIRVEKKVEKSACSLLSCSSSVLLNKYITTSIPKLPWVRACVVVACVCTGCCSSLLYL